MDIKAAKEAGEIALTLEKRSPIIKQLEMYRDNGWLVTGIRVRSADGSQETTQPIDPLSANASAAALSYAIKVYQDQVGELQAKLDAL